MNDTTIPARILNKIRRIRRRSRVLRSFSHLSGPKMTQLGDNDVALVLVGRNVEYFLPRHIEHHLSLGVSRIVYIDNGSTDGSVAAVQAYDQATVASTTADFQTEQSLIRYYANTLYLRGGWRLAIDPDEMLDYPGRPHLSLPELVTRMSARGHDALVAQMLEMVPEGPLSQSHQDSFDDAINSFNRYDLRNIKSYPYHGSSLSWASFLGKNKVTNPQIEILFGGLRNTVFAEDCCLTKHALFRMGPGVTPQLHPHVSTGLTCTDMTAVLKHYKFAGNMLARERKLLQEKRIAHGETALRVARMNDDPDLDLGKHALKCDPTVDDLLAAGFLQITPAATDALGVFLPDEQR